MNELTSGEVEQVSGGLTSTSKGVVFVEISEPIMMPSPAPVIPDLS